MHWDLSVSHSVLLSWDNLTSMPKSMPVHTVWWWQDWHAVLQMQRHHIFARRWYTLIHWWALTSQLSEEASFPLVLHARKLFKSILYTYLVTRKAGLQCSAQSPTSHGDRCLCLPYYWNETAVRQWLRPVLCQLTTIVDSQIPSLPDCDD